jgi:hypothetical protein
VNVHVSATSNGTERSLSIDGHEVGTVSDSTEVGVRLIALGMQNTGASTETATFSDFVYTPLG